MLHLVSKGQFCIDYWQWTLIHSVVMVVVWLEVTSWNGGLNVGVSEIAA